MPWHRGDRSCYWRTAYSQRLYTFYLCRISKASGKKRNFAKGSITRIYTVLVEGDDTNEPVADTVRGILDGHIVLSRQLANANHFPAIDISASISRLMNDIAGEEHRKAASRFRNMLSLYQKNADLISIGAYKKVQTVLWMKQLTA